MLYLVKFVPILDHRQLDIVIHRKHYIVVEGRLFGWTMKSLRVKNNKKEDIIANIIDKIT